MSKTLGIAFVLVCVAVGAFAQEASPAVDPGFEDALLDELVGQWSMKGSVRGEPVEYSLEASWVLGHQFLLLEINDVATAPQYEANIYVGYHPDRDEYVVHWLDRFGGKPSSTLGHGSGEGDTVRLLFDYPSAQFRDTFTFDRESGSWHFHVEARTPEGGWSEFADHTVTRSR